MLPNTLLNTTEPRQLSWMFENDRLINAAGSQEDVVLVFSTSLPASAAWAITSQLLAVSSFSIHGSVLNWFNFTESVIYCLSRCHKWELLFVSPAGSQWTVLLGYLTITSKVTVLTISIMKHVAGDNSILFYFTVHR